MGFRGSSPLWVEWKGRSQIPRLPRLLPHLTPDLQVRYLPGPPPELAESVARAELAP